ncbi:glycosyltransferase family 2 protein [soil metagenome]
MDASLAAPRVAVVIVNYQTYAELHACLASLGPPRDEFAFVVVDHSTTPRAADDIGAAFPHIHLLRVDANEGFAAGVNRGARLLDARYTLLLNPDSIASPDLAPRLADWMDAAPDVGAAGPRIENADGSIQASARRFPDLTTGIAGRSSWLTRVLPRNPLSRRNLDPATRLHAGPANVDWVSGACMIVRREAFESVGGMDEGFFLYWEDADFCRRLTQTGWRIVYNPGFTVRHTGGASSRHAADASLVAFHDSAYRLFTKHAAFPARLLKPAVYLALRIRLAVMRRVVRARSHRAGA